MNAAQVEFDNRYITSSEVCERLEIGRSTLLNATKRGKLPEPILILSPKTDQPLVTLWIREEVEAILVSWLTDLEIRRSQG